LSKKLPKETTLLHGLFRVEAVFEHSVAFPPGPPPRANCAEAQDNACIKKAWVAALSRISFLQISPSHLTGLNWLT
jgi:hypothetical protein